jgi:hypothetical protein
MRRTGTPIWIGEFGPMYPTHHPEQLPWRLQVLRDQLSIYREHGASWSLWTYKDVGLQGVVYADPDSAYMRLTEPVRRLKAQLGTDSWGGSDEGVRDILDPIEAVFDTRFPDYEPYPWGRRQHVFRLVRHILLAEPTAERYAELFRGMDVERARELASAFAFGDMIVRTELADILREHQHTAGAGGPTPPVAGS